MFFNKKVESHVYQIDGDRVSQQEWEAEEDPRQERRLEDDPEEVHPDHRISTCPNVNKHDRQSLTYRT